jgi:FkbM family methyltransferase
MRASSTFAKMAFSHCPVSKIKLKRMLTQTSNVVAKLIRWPLHLIPPDTIVTLRQGRLRGQRWIVGSYNHNCWIGTYESRKRTVFEAIVKPESVVFDIGAHVGFYTLLASVLVGDQGKVFAFEPSHRNLTFLREHIRLNQRGNVVIMEAAVWSEPGVIYFHSGPTSATGWVGQQGEQSVPALQLDQAIASQQLPTPDFMKIDVEGGELHVLRGASRLLSTRRPIIFLATHSVELHRQCCELLRSLVYDLKALGGTDVERSDELLATPRPARATTVSDHE